MFFELIEDNVKQKYYYLWNQIEIIGIVNQNDEVVVTYSYDAYGNVTMGGRDASTIGVKNPFLYRGYYYDHETKLYYCLSRYYNPSWRRWISLDDVSYLEPSKIIGLNLFAYCNNDPINKWDPSGHIPIITLIIAGLVAATANYVYQIFFNENGISYETTENGVQIKNSYKIITPWGRWLYSFYLNHINPEIKDTDLEKTIFNDSHSLYDKNGNVSTEGLMSIVMKCLYIIHHPFSAFYDLLIERKF